MGPEIPAWADVAFRVWIYGGGFACLLCLGLGLLSGRKRKKRERRTWGERIR